jgi:hypothetical protein
LQLLPQIARRIDPHHRGDIGADGGLRRRIDDATLPLDEWRALCSRSSKDDPMLSKIKFLLESPELRKRLQASASQGDAVRLITEAAIDKGQAISRESVSRLMAGLMPGRDELGEQDLLAVAGGLDSKVSSKKSPCLPA